MPNSPPQDGNQTVATGAEDTQQQNQLSESRCNDYVELYVSEICAENDIERLPVQVIEGASKQTMGEQILFGLSIMFEGAESDRNPPEYKDGAEFLQERYKDWGGYSAGVTPEGRQAVMNFITSKSPANVSQKFQMLFDDIQGYLHMVEGAWFMKSVPPAGPPRRPSTTLQQSPIVPITAGGCGVLVLLFCSGVFAGRQQQIPSHETVVLATPNTVFQGIQRALVAICKAGEDYRSGVGNQSPEYAQVLSNMEETYSSWAGYGPHITSQGLDNCSNHFGSLAPEEAARKFEQVYADLLANIDLRGERWRSS